HPRDGPLPFAVASTSHADAVSSRIARLQIIQRECAVRLSAQRIAALIPLITERSRARSNRRKGYARADVVRHARQWRHRDNLIHDQDRAICNWRAAHTADYDTV